MSRINGVIGGVVRPVVRGLTSNKGVGGFNPLDLFASGAYTGFLFDFSKTDQLWQEFSGVTPVTSDGELVGLALEASRWAGRSTAAQIAQAPDEEVANRFDSAGWGVIAGWSFNGTNITAAGATSAVGSLSTHFAPTAGKRYAVTIVVASISGDSLRFRLGNTISGRVISAPGTYTEIITPGATNRFVVAPYAGSGLNCVISAYSIKEVVGNHGAQATSAARPAWKTGGFLRGDAADDNLPTPFLCGASGNSGAARVTVPASIAATQIVFGASGSSANRFFAGFNTSGQLVGGVGSDSTTTVLHAADYRGLTGTMALVEDGTNWFLYWEGVQVATGARNGAPTTTIPWCIFAFNNNGTAASFAVADARRMLAITRALTAAEVAKLSTHWSTS